MKCYACGKISPLTSWRAVNISADTKGTIEKNRNPSKISYYALSGSKSQYNILYACPKCGTLRIKTPTDRN